MALDVACLVNCSDPIPPTDGMIMSYSDTRLGANITYSCNTGHRPTAPVNSICTVSAMWIPLPICTFVEGKKSSLLLCQAACQA